jgi:protein TonB
MNKWAAAAVLGLTLACASTPPATKAVRVGMPLPGRPLAELEAALGSENAEERRAAAWALAGAGSPTPELRQALTRMRDGDPDEKVRLAAEWALGHLIPVTPAVPGVTAGSRREDAYDTPPRLVRQTRPTYPPDAYAQGIMGNVEVELLIDERGDVTHAQVSASIPALDAAALECVRGWKFNPAVKGGRPVPTMAVAPVTFKIY